jgi:hypothetical protein
MPKKGNAPRNPTECHPDRKHFARGLCKNCYDSWYARHNEKRTNHVKTRWRAANPEKTKAAKLRYLYGVEPEEVEEMRRKQKDRCAICREKDPLHIDHDHVTGIFRGLLCGNCNRGIGCLGDDPKRLRSAALYLRKKR